MVSSRSWERAKCLFKEVSCVWYGHMGSTTSLICITWLREIYWDDFIYHRTGSDGGTRKLTTKLWLSGWMKLSLPILHYLQVYGINEILNTQNIDGTIACNCQLLPEKSTYFCDRLIKCKLLIFKIYFALRLSVCMLLCSFVLCKALITTW